MSSSPIDDIRQQKQLLRKEIRSKLKELSAEDISVQSSKVWERLFEMPVYKESKSIGLFLSMPSHEISTDLVLQHAIQNDKTVFVPEVGKNFELSDMELIQVVLSEKKRDDGKIFHHDWPRNKWKIPEPPQDMPRIQAKPGDIDLLIVPGLAFDTSGGRLGQGKGYYDRFIARIKQDSKPTLVAVALEPQLVDSSIPVSHHDFIMEMVLFPNQTIIVDKK